MAEKKCKDVKCILYFDHNSYYAHTSCQTLNGEEGSSLFFVAIYTSLWETGSMPASLENSIPPYTTCSKRNKIKSQVLDNPDICTVLQGPGLLAIASQNISNNQILSPGERFYLWSFCSHGQKFSPVKIFSHGKDYVEPIVTLPCGGQNLFYRLMQR